MGNFSKFDLQYASCFSIFFVLILINRGLAQPIYNLYSQSLDPVLQWHTRQLFPSIQEHDSIARVWPQSSTGRQELFSVQYSHEGVLDSAAGFFIRASFKKPDVLMLGKQQGKNLQINYIKNSIGEADTVYNFLFHYSADGKIKRIEVRQPMGNASANSRLIGDHRIHYSNGGRLAQIDWIHVLTGNGSVALHQREKFKRDSSGAIQSIHIYENINGNFKLKAKRLNSYHYNGVDTILTRQNVEIYSYNPNNGAVIDTGKKRLILRRNSQGSISQINEYSYLAGSQVYELNHITHYLKTKKHINTLEEKGFTPQFFPNPVEKWLRIKGENRGSYTLTNTAGQVVQRGTLTNGNINVQGLPSGWYTLHWYSEQGSHSSTQKILKH